MSDKETVWSVDGVNFVFNHKLAAIKSIIEEKGGVNAADPIWFTESYTPDVTQFVDVEAVIDTMKQKAIATYGEMSMNRVLVASDTDKEVLRRVLNSWATNSIATMFLVTSEPAQYLITEEDLVMLETPEQRQARREKDFIAKIEAKFTPDMTIEQRELTINGALLAFRQLIPA